MGGFERQLKESIKTYVNDQPDRLKTFHLERICGAVNYWHQNQDVYGFTGNAELLVRVLTYVRKEIGGDEDVANRQRKYLRGVDEEGEDSEEAQMAKRKLEQAKAAESSAVTFLALTAPTQMLIEDGSRGSNSELSVLQSELAKVEAELLSMKERVMALSEERDQAVGKNETLAAERDAKDKAIETMQKEIHYWREFKKKLDENRNKNDNEPESKKRKEAQDEEKTEVPNKKNKVSASSSRNSKN